MFAIYELPSSELPDLHDGTLQDWEVVLRPSLDHRDFSTVVYQGALAGLAVPQESIAFQVYLAWHHSSQRLFVSVERFDATHTFRIPPELFSTQIDLSNDDTSPFCCSLFDRVTLWIDGDHSGGLCVYPDRSSSKETLIAVDNVGCQYYEMVPEADGVRRIRTPAYAPQWALDPPYVDGDGFRYGESPSLSGYELYITLWDELRYDQFDSRRSRLEAGGIVGFQIEVWDVDDTFDWQGRLGGHLPFSFYSVSGRAAVSAARFVDGLLIPCSVGDCSGPESSAVQTDSWARIKAAFAR